MRSQEEIIIIILRYLHIFKFRNTQLYKKKIECFSIRSNFLTLETFHCQQLLRVLLVRLKFNLR